MRTTFGRYMTENFKMPRLRRQDLVNLEKAIRTRLAPSEFHVAFGGHEYDSIEEIPSDAPPTSTLVFYTQAPALRLKLGKSWAELYVPEVLPPMESGLDEIKEMIKKTERPIFWKFCKLAAWCAPLVSYGSITVGALLIYDGYTPRTPTIVVALLLGVLGSLWWALGFRQTFYSFSRVHF